MRDFVREESISNADFIYPIFVKDGENEKNPIESMPGIYQYSLDRITEEIDRVLEARIPGILIFGIPAHKDELGSEAYNPDGITQRAIRRIKEYAPELLIIADVCMCEYTSHGHCGIIHNYDVDNDATVPYMVKVAVSLAQAGADIVAPSDMMDGRVAAIREGLDQAGLSHIPVMSYSAKFASAYYGPFRDAAGSAPHFGDRKSYQMDPANGREAMREIEDDLEEGADFIIVKPALAYLDIMRSARDYFDIPLIAYNVSGEYSMVKAAAANGWIDEKRTVMENMISMKRAGANRIISYHALDVCRWLQEE